MASLSPVLFIPGRRRVPVAPPAPPRPEPSSSIVWIGSPNYTPGRPSAPVAFVVHSMGGTLAGTDSTFQDPINSRDPRYANPVSAHFGVGLHGDTHQYVKLDNTAWANGIFDPGNTWMARFGPQNPNGRTVSCETEDLGHLDTAVSDAEYQGTLDCALVAVQHFPSIQVVTSHHVIEPINRVNCCGKRWIDSGRLAALAKAVGLELFV